MLDALFKRGPLFLLIAAACVACGGGAPADPPGSIAVEYRNLAYEFDDDGEFHDLPIAVGDQVACSISLRHVRSDEGRADTPPRIFSQAEWAFVSNDGGALYHSPAKPIRGWFGGGLPQHPAGRGRLPASQHVPRPEQRSERVPGRAGTVRLRLLRDGGRGATAL